MPSIIDQFRLTGKIALVTGGGRGLGRVCALALAEAGADVALVDLAGASTAAVASEIRALGRRAIAFDCDVTRSAEVDVVISRVIAELGGIDIVLNNAGICIHEAAETMSDEQWLRVINVDLNAVYFIAGAVAASSTRLRCQAASSIALRLSVPTTPPKPELSS